MFKKQETKEIEKKELPEELNGKQFIIRNGIFHCQTFRNKTIQDKIAKLPHNSLIRVNEKDLPSDKNCYYYLIKLDFPSKIEEEKITLKKYKYLEHDYFEKKEEVKIINSSKIKKGKNYKIDYDFNSNELSEEQQKKMKIEKGIEIEKGSNLKKISKTEVEVTFLNEETGKEIINTYPTEVIEKINLPLIIKK